MEDNVFAADTQTLSQRVRFTESQLNAKEKDLNSAREIILSMQEELSACGLAIRKKNATIDEKQKIIDELKTKLTASGAHKAEIELKRKDVEVAALEEKLRTMAEQKKQTIAQLTTRHEEAEAFLQEQLQVADGKVLELEKSAEQYKMFSALEADLRKALASAQARMENEQALREKELKLKDQAMAQLARANELLAGEQKANAELKRMMETEVVANAELSALVEKLKQAQGGGQGGDMLDAVEIKEEADKLRVETEKLMDEMEKLKTELYTSRVNNEKLKKDLVAEQRKNSMEAMRKEAPLPRGGETDENKQNGAMKSLRSAYASKEREVAELRKQLSVLEGISVAHAEQNQEMAVLKEMVRAARLESQTKNVQIRTLNKKLEHGVQSPTAVRR